ELPAFVADWKGSNARIVVDPLTPVLWSTKDLYEQRDLIGYMFKQTRKVGTVLCTLEEHGQGDLAGPETVIPMYLADCVVHLKFNSDPANPSRLLNIVKCRNSRHSPSAHPFQIVRGLGIARRRQVFRYFCLRPCARIGDISRALKMSQATVRWHAWDLTENRYLISEGVSIFPAGLIDPGDVSLFGALATTGRAAVLAAAFDVPEISFQDVAPRVGLTRQSVSKVASELAEFGLVRLVDDGRF